MKEQFNILLIALLFVACSKEEYIPLDHDFEIDARLPIDSNGYYHLQLDTDWQTLHRISGSVPSITQDYNTAKVHWSSSHFWYIGDTLGYIVHQNNTLNDYYYYMTPDTTYITWFEGHEVPVVNSISYQTNDGEINTMIAPVRSMIYDTLSIRAYPEFADGYIGSKIEIKIILN